jgi:hypothetical protein
MSTEHEPSFKQGTAEQGLTESWKRYAYQFKRIRNRKKSEPLAAKLFCEPLTSFSGLFHSDCKSILCLQTMYIYYAYLAMSKSLKTTARLSNIAGKQLPDCLK